MGRGSGINNGLARKVRPRRPGTSRGLVSRTYPPDAETRDEIQAPAMPVDAKRHAPADAGSIPAASTVAMYSTALRALSAGGRFGAGERTRPLTAGITGLYSRL